FALSEPASGTCASRGRVLRARADPGAAIGFVSLELPRALEHASIAPVLFRDDLGRGEVSLEVDGAGVRRWPLGEPSAAHCAALEAAHVGAARSIRLLLEPRAGGVLSLDRVVARFEKR